MSQAMSLTQYKMIQEDAPALWTPVTEYSERIMERRNLRSWDFPPDNWSLAELSSIPHRGSLHPTSVWMTLGHGWRYDYSEAIAWIADEMQARGILFTEFPNLRTVRSFRDGSENAGTVIASMPVPLDLERHWRPVGGKTLAEVRASNTNFLPSLEVLWLLALNPEYCAAMDNQRYPYIWVPGSGLGTTDSGAICIGRGNSGVFAFGRPDNDPYGGTIPVYDWEV